MTAVWDEATFGNAPEFAGYADVPRPNVIASEAEIGDGKRRRRYTGKLRSISFPYTWSFATFRAFYNWYKNDVAEGAVNFTMTDRVMDVTGTFRLDPAAPYTVDPAGPGALRVTINATRIS